MHRHKLTDELWTFAGDVRTVFTLPRTIFTIKNSFVFLLRFMFLTDFWIRVLFHGKRKWNETHAHRNFKILTEKNNIQITFVCLLDVLVSWKTVQSIMPKWIIATYPILQCAPAQMWWQQIFRAKQMAVEVEEDIQMKIPIGHLNVSCRWLFPYFLASLDLSVWWAML